jgi:tRNA nucleotidyltransferase (CCA-adding enzyme)
MPDLRKPEEGLQPVTRVSPYALSRSVIQVALAIKTAGGRAFLVGGCVRDLLMDKPSKDIDIEVYGMQPDDLENCLTALGKVDKVGKSFGVMKLWYGGEEFDVSIPRREQKTGKGNKGFIASPDPTMTLTDAGRRRDFTINAIALDVTTGDVYDPHGGVADLKARLLRATDPSAFSEDPLRILRGAQFAARHRMSVHPDTMKLMQDAKHELKDLPKERVHAEWKKLLTKGEDPSRGVAVLLQSGAMEVLHPEIYALGEHWIHAATYRLDRLAQRVKGLTDVSRDAVQHAVLLRDLLVPPEVAGRIAVEQFGAVKAGAAKVVALVQEAATVVKSQWLHGKPFGEGDIRRLAGRLHPATVEELALVVTSLDSEQEWFIEYAERHGVHNGPTKPLLTGKHLAEMGVQQGPKVGEIIKLVLELQLDGQVRTVEAAREAAKRYL